MIIWLNGAFGSGKTTTAYELHQRLENSWVYDPENVGYFLRKNIPKAYHTPDFQDMPLWRDFNYRLLKDLHETYPGTVIVPMTLVNPAYFQEIVQRLTDEGVPIVHIILYASRETILKRLNKRSLGRLNREAFAVEAIDRCLAFFDRPAPGVRIETDCMTAEQVVETVAQACGLTLPPDRRGVLERKLARLKTTVAHIRGGAAERPVNLALHCASAPKPPHGDGSRPPNEAASPSRETISE